MLRLCVPILLLSTCTLASLPGQGRATTGGLDDDWQFDLIHTRSGKVYKGLLVAESPAYVKFWRILRSPGRPTRRMFWSYEANEIARIERLNPEQRQLLKARIQALDPDHERECLEKLQLLHVAWQGESTGGLCYRSEYFLLTSDAREEIVRRAAFRLDRLYTALARLMPPRRTAPPTRIVLIRSLKEYRQALARKGFGFANPAYYDRERQEIVCACDLERLGTELATIQRNHQQARERLRAQERALEREHRGAALQKLLKPLSAQLANLDELDRNNERQFEEASKRFFETLYHEACHAYLSTFVYAKRDRMPSWLQEGLAQIFETAILDGMEFRIGHRDPVQLERVRQGRRRGELPGLVELLCSNSRQFIASHSQDKAATDGYYLSAWALAHHLVFERELLGTAEFDAYIAALEAGADPVEAFDQLVGEPPVKFLESMPAELRLTLTTAEALVDQSASTNAVLRKR
jgi:hypothetical protein